MSVTSSNARWYSRWSFGRGAARECALVPKSCPALAGRFAVKPDIRWRTQEVTLAVPLLGIERP